jgi:hypothetical protein
VETLAAALALPALVLAAIVLFHGWRSRGTARAAERERHPVAGGDFVG